MCVVCCVNVCMCVYVYMCCVVSHVRRYGGRGVCQSAQEAYTVIKKDGSQAEYNGSKKK